MNARITTRKLKFEQIIKKKTIETFKRLNWYFDEGIYNDQLQSLSEQTGEKVRSTAVQQWIVICRSLNDYKKQNFLKILYSILKMKIQIRNIIQKWFRKH